MAKSIEGTDGEGGFDKLSQSRSSQLVFGLSWLGTVFVSEWPNNEE